MYCTKCGLENKDDATFCNSCGSPLKSLDTYAKGSAENDKSKNSQKVTLGLIASWVFGVLFLLAGIGGVFAGDFSGLLFILASFFSLPPTMKLVEKKLHFTLSKGLRVTLVIFLCFMVTFIPTQPASTNQDSYNPSASSAALSEPAYYSQGEKVKVGDIEYTLNSAEVTDVVGNSFMYEEADGIFIIVDLTIENTGSQSKDISSNYVKVIDSKGRVFESDSAAWIYLDNNLLFKQLQPGLPTRGEAIFDVPRGEKFVLQVTDSLWETNKKYIALGSTE